MTKDEILKLAEFDADNMPVSIEAQKYIELLFKCEPPCDSHGVCANCCDLTTFLAGYNFGYRAHRPLIEALATANEKLVEVFESISNRIGMDALQQEHEPGWDSPEGFELTIKLQKKWFTEMRKALAANQAAMDEIGRWK